MGSFGRYSGGGSLYDRSIYLELANAAGDIRRDIKSERIFVDKPRLNLCMNGHPHSFIDFFKGERDLKQDGLAQRFFASCPEPSYYMSEDIMNSENEEFSISLLLYYIYKKHDVNDAVYSLSTDANIVFNGYYDIYKKIIRDATIKNTFVNSMCGKAPTQLLRLTCILQALHEAFDFIHIYSGNKDVISEDFVEKVKSWIKEHDTFVITTINVIRAKSLLDYFNKSKLILSGFVCNDWSESIDIILSDLVNPTIMTEDENLAFEETLKSRIYQKLLISDQKTFNLNTLNQSFKGRGSNKVFIHDIFRNLENLNFGEREDKTNARGPPSTFFKRKYIQSLTQEMINELESVNIRPDLFMALNKRSNFNITLKIKKYVIRLYRIFYKGDYDLYSPTTSVASKCNDNKLSKKTS